MKSFRQIATAQQQPASTVSARALARSAGVPLPTGLSHLIDALSAPVSFHQVVVTPSGTALGGTVDVTVSRDGSFSFNVHMHDSGFDPYTFRVRCVLQSPGGVALMFQTSGHTDGTGSNPLGKVNRDFDHHENGSNPLISQFWLDARASKMSVSKSYEDAGALHTIEDIAKDLLGFLMADVAFGPGLALVIAVSAELSNALNASFVGPGGLVGVVVAGGVVWMFGPAALVPAVIAGVVGGAVTDALIKHRQMTDLEYQFAGVVFGNTLPPKERIYLTNLSHGGGRCYTWPSVDGSTIVNLNLAFDDPMHHAEGSYPANGQVFIHELTHAWQIKTKSFVPGIACKYLTETDSYDYGNLGGKWSDYGIEQQAAIVDHWFGKYAGAWSTIEDVANNLAQPSAIKDPAFRYIANNIRLGQN